MINNADRQVAWTLKTAAEWLGVEPGWSASLTETAIAGASIDSRKVKSGELFFALTGDHQDGHRFVNEALDKNAAGAVVAAEWALQQPEARKRSLIPVDQPLEAMALLSTQWRKAMQLKTIGLTGSCGKTTTKEMIHFLLSPFLPIGMTIGNFNNLIGLPLSILNLDRQAGWMVAEMGMSYEGEIAKLTKILEPSFGLMLNVNPVHLVNFDSLQEIAIAKGELVENMSDDAVLVANCDDPWVTWMTLKARQKRIITFGTQGEFDVTADDIRRRQQGLSFRVSWRDKTCLVETNVLGSYHVDNFLAALATLYAVGIDIHEGVERLRDFQPPPMRGRVVAINENMQLIDDSYNANPQSMKAALEFLYAVASGRRVAVLGDMLELGPLTRPAHYQLGESAADSQVDLLLAVGDQACHIIEGAFEGGMDSHQLHRFDGVEQVAPELPRLLRPNDTILIKGSRGVHLDKIADVLVDGRTH